jgi:hypothetical protein
MKHPIETPLETPNTFDLFWKAYPRKTAKGAARKAWDKLKPEEQLAATEGAQRFASDPNRDETFTPHPATWINAERWLDEPLPPRKLTPEALRAQEMVAARERAARETEAGKRLAELEERARENAVPMPEYIKDLLKRV